MNKNWSIGIGKEVALVQVIRALTIRRIINALKISASFIFSALLKKEIVWGVPPILNIEPTNHCNLRCPLCITGSGQMRRSLGRMDFKLFKELVDELGDKIIYITLYHQGEPYLHKEFNKFVAYAKSGGVYVNTSSNAHFFNIRNSLEVVKSGLDSMIISLDGTTQETFGHYRVGGSFRKAVQGIRNLVTAKRQLNSKIPYIFVQFLVMKHNEHEIPAIRQLADELDVDRLLIKTIQVNTIEEALDWLPSEEKFRRYQVKDGKLQIKRGRGTCPRVWFTSLVDWDGQVVPCCFDKNADYPLGKVESRRNFSSIWKGEKYSSFRKRMLHNRGGIKICRNCNYGIGLFT